MKHARIRFSFQRGLGLIELMVALTIGLLILAGVSTVFVNAGKSYTTQERLARTQDNGRFAMYYLVRDLRMAGFTGCLRDLDTNFSNDLNTTTGFFLGSTNFAVPLEGIDNVSITSPKWYPSNDTGLPANVWKDTLAKPDLLAIRAVDTSAVAKVTDSPMSDTSANVAVDSTASFQKGDVVVLSDCIRADTFQISDTPASSKLPHGTGGTASPGNSTAQLSKLYDTAARVYKFSTRRYYIGLNANNVPSLYRDDNAVNAVELVEGIESLQVLYGVTDTPPNGPPSAYHKADAMAAADWPKVVSVKIGILARTPNSKTTDIDTNTYNVNGTTLGPFNDRNSRRMFITTVSLKNRTLQ
jgi:type IV pilus assembly protein PilW